MEGERLSQPKMVTCPIEIEALAHDCAFSFYQVDWELDEVQRTVDDGEHTSHIADPHAKEFLQMLMTGEIELLQFLVSLHGMRITADRDYEQPVFSANRHRLLVKTFEDQIAHPEFWFPENYPPFEIPKLITTYLAQYAGQKIDFENLNIFAFTERISLLVEAIQEMQRATYERFLNKAA